MYFVFMNVFISMDNEEIQLLFNYLINNFIYNYYLKY